MGTFTLDDLAKIIDERAGDPQEISYTASLLNKGTAKCAEKFGEEAVEAVIAAVSGNRTELTKESADVLFHLLVLLKDAGVPFSEVLEELSARTIQSGHQEKASREG